MANLSEEATWEPGVYQLEETDVVQGGPDGIDNEQAKALANRTTYLKQQVELRAPLASPALTGSPEAPTPAQGNESDRLATTAFVAQAITAILNAPPATLDTLNELAAALGDDPNFAATVTALLSQKAPLASPDLTGVPKAPTAGPGTNSTQIASTAFVQSALAGLGWLDRNAVAADLALDATNSGQLVDVDTTATDITITLAGAGNGAGEDPDGTYFLLRNAGSKTLNIASGSADIRLPGGHLVSSLKLPALGSNIVLRSDGTTYAVLWQSGADSVFSARCSASHVLQSNIFTKTQFDTVLEDLDGSYDAANSRFVCQRPGRYLFVASVKVAASADASECTTEIYVNGSTDRRGGHQVLGYAGPPSNVVFSEVDLNAGDYVEVFAWQNASINLSIQESPALSYFFGRRVA